MKKAVKIGLVIGSIVIILGGVGAFVGTLLYTKNNINHVVGEATLTNHIYLDIIEFVGYIRAEVPLNVTNGGLYPIRNLTISLIVHGEEFTLTPFLNGLKLGEGTNSLGDIAPGSTWSGVLAINMTIQIATLAIQSGTMKICVDISLQLDFGIYKMPYTTSEIQIEQWDAPY